MLVGQGLQQACPDEYFYQASSSQCVRCNDPTTDLGRCLTCTSFGQCTTCPKGYFLLTYSKTCQKCSNANASCTGYANSIYNNDTSIGTSGNFFIFLLIIVLLFFCARFMCAVCRKSSNEVDNSNPNATKNIEEGKSVRQLQKLEMQQVELANQEHASLIQQLKRKVSLDYYMRNNISTKTDISTFLHASLRPDTDALLKLAKAQAFPHKKEPAKPQ